MRAFSLLKYSATSSFPYLLVGLGIIVTALMPQANASATTESAATTQTNASTTYFFSDITWKTAVHPNVVSFSRGIDGTYHGITDDRRTFVQFPFFQNTEYRIERFEIDAHHHYIVNGIIYDSLETFPEEIRTLGTEKPTL